MTLRRQKGVAVIVAMLVVALAATVAAGMLWSGQMWARQVENAGDRTQATQLADAAIDWGRAVLADDARNSRTDHGGEAWATRLAPLTVEGGEIGGRLEDRQGLFNLNGVVRGGQVVEREVAKLRRLLALLNLPQDLADAVVDWVDADSEARYPGGAEDVYYLAQPAPYRTANRPLADAAELARVRGFDPGVIARLRDSVTVLPVSGPVNVNTAPAEVLAACIDGLSLGEARRLAASRRETPFADLEDFRRRLPPGNFPVGSEEFAVSSQFFEARADARVGRARIVMRALLRRDGNAWPAIVWKRNG